MTVIATADPFYVEILDRLVRDGVLDSTARTLVVAGGRPDRDALLACGFSDVTISNLGDRNFDCPPYQWCRLDAEDIALPDGAYPQVIVHAGLHHCRSPHRGLLEMYRVASRVSVVFEARDSALMRAAVRLGLAAEFEHEAVHNGKLNGVRGTAIANFVYRWTEREVRKTLASYDPEHPSDIRFFYGLRLPTYRLNRFHPPWKRAVANVAAPPIRALFNLLPREGNEFAFAITKLKDQTGA